MIELFSKSEKFTEEYCISVVTIGELTPIEGSDFLAQTFVNGESIVVRKDGVKKGDIMFYASNECQLSKEYLAVNSLFEHGARELNANYKEVQALIDAGREDEAKRMIGFFNKHGRVRMIRLRKVPSMGYLFTLSSLAKWKPEVADVDMRSLVGQDFDTVCGELFVKAYVPERPPRTVSDGNGRRKGPMKIERFDRKVEGEFLLHYDSAPFPKSVQNFSPEDVVSISVKVHGTSAVYANVRVKKPLLLPFYKKWWNRLIDTTGWLPSFRFKDFEVGYGSMFASRTVVKNEFISKVSRRMARKMKKAARKAGTEAAVQGRVLVPKPDVWREYGELLAPYIPEGFTVYGEIFGYATGLRMMIQKEYDYGCEEGTNKFMPYRISSKGEDGKRREWNVEEVRQWTLCLMADHPEIAARLRPIDILYHGTLGSLYPDIAVDEHWPEHLLDALRHDKERFGMEQNEVLCRNKVPREGLCIRKDNDPLLENFKLKCDLFRNRELKAIDAGEVDIEMQESYS